MRQEAIDRIERLDPKRRRGIALILVAVLLLILTLIGAGILKVAYSARYHAIRETNDARALLAAEAGYEDAIFWMSQQQDLSYVLQGGGAYTDSISLGDARSDYSVSFFSYLGSRPSYKISSLGHCGNAVHNVEVVVVQAIGGWEMGMCRVPNSSGATSPVYFAGGEIINMPIHINQLNDSPDERDIYITNSPRFVEPVSMGEERRTDGGSDKYSGVMNFFEAGISFGQPDTQITNEQTVQQKVNRFRDSTNTHFRFRPLADTAVSFPRVPAVQLEFYVDGGVGKIRITNNCTVKGFMQSYDSRTWDYMVAPGSGGSSYTRYPIYAYHLARQNAEVTGERYIVNVEDTYVTQTIGGVESQPGGQIYVDGNVVIGGDLTGINADQVIDGRVTIVATGNIWIADSLRLNGPRGGNGLPSESNPSALGLIAQGVVRIVDPGMSSHGGAPSVPSGLSYEPIGYRDSGSSEYQRHLPDPIHIEAAIITGGGGFGAENVRRDSYGGRKELSGDQDRLILFGALTEVIRGVVGLIGRDGYIKQYYFDRRLLKGILPGDMWLKNKYIPAPAGWTDTRFIN